MTEFIPFWTPPFPHEPFSSAFCRLSELSGVKPAVLFEVVFGHRHRGITLFFPARLQRFIDALGPSPTVSAAAIIDTATPLPLFMPFLSPDIVNQIRQDMILANSGGLHMRSGVMASSIPLPTHFRYCPACVQEDKAQSIKPYWRLFHLLPTVWLCPIHQERLRTTHLPLSGLDQRIYPLSLAGYLQQTTGQTPTELTFPQAPEFWRCLAHLATDSLWLLEHPLMLAEGKLRTLYQQQLQKRGYANRRQQVQATAVQRAFIAHYGADLLTWLNCLPQENDPWLPKLWRNHDHSLHPLHHLLFIRFLDLSVADFFTPAPPDTPFGQGPYPCLNPTCPDFQTLVIPTVHISTDYTGNRPRGDFRCPTCGQQFYRLGPDKFPADRLTFTRMVAYGPIWEATLRSGWLNPTVSLRELGRRLGVTVRTVKYQAQRLSLPERSGVSRRLKIEQTVPPNTTQVLQTKRQAWQQALKEAAPQGVKQARQQEPALYIWLYRHDYDWLMAQNQQWYSQRPTPQQRVDWPVRDISIALACLQAYGGLHLDSERIPIIRPTTVARRTQSKAIIEQHADKLPYTTALLQRLAESRISAAIRRIWWTVTYIEGARSLHPWQLIHQAGASRLNQEPAVKLAANQALKGQHFQSVWLPGNIAQLARQLNNDLISSPIYQPASVFPLEKSPTIHVWRKHDPS